MAGATARAASALKESDLFEPVKVLLESHGYTVYSEVKGPEGRADIVATHGPELIVVELKTSLSLDLMEQALNWRHHAQRVYVAVPRPKARVNYFATTVLHREGIGLILVDFSYRYDTPTADLQHFPRAAFNRKASPYLRNGLCEEQRSGPPGGSSGGGYVTEYSLTMERVRDFLRRTTRDGEWVTITDILADVETHYMAPKSSLARSLLSFEAAWCETEKRGGKLNFRYKQEPRA